MREDNLSHIKGTVPTAVPLIGADAIRGARRIVHIVYDTGIKQCDDQLVGALRLIDGNAVRIPFPELCVPITNYGLRPACMLMQYNAVYLTHYQHEGLCAI